MFLADHHGIKDRYLRERPRLLRSSRSGKEPDPRPTNSDTGAAMIRDLFRCNFRKKVRDAVRHFLEAIDN